jgi:hypothetical protein
LEVVAAFKKTMANCSLVWGVRALGFSPILALFLLLAEAILGGSNDILPWIVFLYMIGSFACFFPGLVGMLRFSEQEGLKDGSLFGWTTAQGQIWFSVLRQAFFIEKSKAARPSSTLSRRS